VFLEDVPDALRRLLVRYAATHGPFTTADVRARYGIDVSAALRELERSGGLVRGELRPGGVDREWCDPEVLRRLRRASLAVLRKEIEPAEARELARFLPAWQGVDRHPASGAGIDRLREALVPLQGLALPAEVWERDVLPRRVGAYSPSWIDQLCAAGEVVWIGAGALGRNSGRVALYFREDLPLLGPPPYRGDMPSEPAHEAVRARLAAGACFFTDLLVDVAESPEQIQEALWDLAWAGEATNDAFAPLRAPRLTLARAQRETVRRSTRRAGRFGAGRRRDGAAAQVQGRWSLTEPLTRSHLSAVDPAARRRALGELLLERYGIVTREQVLAEGIAGGFSAIYPELSQLETLGVARRGYFLEGLGGAQFALPGAVERLRAVGGSGAPEAPPLVIAAVDPAQPYGAALPWPKRPGEESPARRPARTAGAYVVLVGGDPVIYLERGGRALQTLVTAQDARLRPALGALVDHVRSGAIKRVALEKVDGEPAMSCALAPLLSELGFQEGPRRLTLTA
jgi:ATP-dependent Lhr-like helicase